MYNKSPLLNKEFSYKDYLFVFLISLILIGTIFFEPAFAAGGNTYATAISDVKDLVDLVSGYFNSLCVVALGFALIRIVVTRSQKGTDDAIKWFKTIIIVFIIFNILGTFVGWVNQIVPSHTYTYNGPGSLSQAVADSKK